MQIYNYAMIDVATYVYNTHSNIAIGSYASITAVTIVIIYCMWPVCTMVAK